MGFEPIDLRNYVHLRSLLDVFEQRVLAYCSSPNNPQERFERIKEIKAVLAGNKKLPSDTIVVRGCPPCGAGEVCEGHVCLPERVRSGWPATDPQSWDA